MSRVFIVGGAGKIARRLARRLADRGHEVRSMYRHDDQENELRALGAVPVRGSLLDLDTDGLAQLMTGNDMVVFSAGAGGKGGPEMTNAVDGKGLELSVAAAKQAGIQRFLLVSAFPESALGRETTERFQNYLRVKKRADAHLTESGLDWVILRPGTLTDLPGTGKVRAGVAIPYGSVSRDDVAAAMLEIIERPELSRIIIELTEGETPVSNALQRLARQ